MRYQVVAKDGIKVGSTGDQWQCGSYISDRALPRKLFKALLDEGAIVAIGEDEPVIDATPTAVARSAEHGIALKDVLGTGKDGRVLASDVDAYIQDHAA